jgi:Fe-S-cluster containining protein
MRRQDLKPGEVLCTYCTARCCRYFAFPIDKPESREDFDNLRWYMMVTADCKHLLPDNRCGHYEHRPQICRDYTTDNCEYDDDAVYDQFFETPEQMWEYADAVLPREKPRKFSVAPVDPREVNLPLAVAVG